MKATHQQLIEKIMEYFKNHPGVGKFASVITKDMLEQIYNEFLEGLEEPTNSADAIFEQAASLETEITGTVDKIVDEINSLNGKGWDGNSHSVAARGYESVKKLITAVQDHAIQDNREMIRELKNHITILSADVALMNKRLLNLENQDD